MRRKWLLLFLIIFSIFFVSSRVHAEDWDYVCVYEGRDVTETLEFRLHLYIYSTSKKAALKCSFYSVDKPTPSTKEETCRKTVKWGNNTYQFDFSNDVTKDLYNAYDKKNGSRGYGACPAIYLHRQQNGVQKFTGKQPGDVESNYTAWREEPEWSKQNDKGEYIVGPSQKKECKFITDVNPDASWPYMLELHVEEDTYESRKNGSSTKELRYSVNLPAGQITRFDNIYASATTFQTVFKDKNGVSMNLKEGSPGILKTFITTDGNLCHSGSDYVLGPTNDSCIPNTTWSCESGKKLEKARDKFNEIVNKIKSSKGKDCSKALVDEYISVKEEISNLWSNFDITEGDNIVGSYCGFDLDACQVVPPEIKTWIVNILKIVRYLALALVIVLGSLDFMKAAGSGEPDQMKKAGQAFVKRLIAVIVLFLLPYIVELLLGLIELLGADPNCVDIGSY